ncbi:TcpE family conjugal transfer membrane protein [Clostridium saccharoperbutylacetonicum]|uniref:TcpE family conjugal transfer membrane protein n=1 Tax=Clostridium saccharoperbutylacetonicum TaxID=36745 RepID=UPI0039ECD98E
MESKEKIIISYNKIYLLEPKVYVIGNVRLPQPVPIYTAVAFAVSLLIIFVLTKIIPIPIPGAIKYLLLPYLLAKKVTISKKDGKNILKYYAGYISYLIQKKMQFERFKEVEQIKKIEFFK